MPARPKIPEAVAFGRRVRGLREERGLTTMDLGNLAGMAPRQLSAIERGEAEVKLRTILRIAKALGVHPGALLSDAPADSRASADTERSEAQRAARRRQARRDARLRREEHGEAPAGSLAGARRDAGLTQEQAAERTGIGLRTLRRMENGELTDMKVSRVLQLAALYGCGIDDLIDPARRKTHGL